MRHQHQKTCALADNAFDPNAAKLVVCDAHALWLLSLHSMPHAALLFNRRGQLKHRLSQYEHNTRSALLGIVSSSQPGDAHVPRPAMSHVAAHHPDPPSQLLGRSSIKHNITPIAAHKRCSLRMLPHHIVCGGHTLLKVMSS